MAAPEAIINTAGVATTAKTADMTAGNGGGVSGGAEIPCWIFGQLKWVSGINRNTTAEEVRIFS